MSTQDTLLSLSSDLYSRLEEISTELKNLNSIPSKQLDQSELIGLAPSFDDRFSKVDQVSDKIVARNSKLNQLMQRVGNLNNSNATASRVTHQTIGSIHSKLTQSLDHVAEQNSKRNERLIIRASNNGSKKLSHLNIS